MTSHLLAFSLFEALRAKYPELDLFRFLRLSHEQRAIPFSEFLEAASRQHKRLTDAAARGELYLDDELKTSDTEAWVKDGVSQLGIFHGSAVVKIEDGAIFTEDLPLLYYYRNRLSGYGLSKDDAKGFLA